MKCPTCGRRGSERVAPREQRRVIQGVAFEHYCHDQFHDAADAAPQLVEALRQALPWLENRCSEEIVERARAALDAVKGEEASRE